MNRRRIALGAVAVFAAAALGFVPAARAADELTVPVILPLTGGGAFLGGTQRKTLEVLESTINKEGGIKGKQLKFEFNDDQTSPQVAVQLANKFKSQSPVILGSSLSAMCKAIAPVYQADGPVNYCLSPAIYPPSGSYVFSTSVSTKDLQVATLRWFREKGLKRYAVIATTDASGQDGVDDIAEANRRPENKDLVNVDTERFNPGDVSIAAQAAKIKAAKPQAIIVWVPGTPFATAIRGLNDVGVSVPTVSTSANMVVRQLEQYTSFLPKELYFAGITYAANVAPNAQVKKQQQEWESAMKAAGAATDMQSGMAWDAGLIVASAFKQLGPTASAKQIHDYIEGLKSFPGIVGEYNFSDGNQRGTSVQDVVMMRWQPDKGWTTASGLGGALK